MKNKSTGDIYFVVLFTLLMQNGAEAEPPKDESAPGEAETEVD